jgi:hypothetical protein
MDDYMIILTWLDKKSKTVTTTMKLTFQNEAQANRAYEANKKQHPDLPYEIVALKLY